MWLTAWFGVCVLAVSTVPAASHDVASGGDLLRAHITSRTLKRAHHLSDIRYSMMGKEFEPCDKDYCCTDGMSCYKYEKYDNGKDNSIYQCMYSKYSCDSSKKVDYRWQCDYPVSCKYQGGGTPSTPSKEFQPCDKDYCCTDGMSCYKYEKYDNGKDNSIYQCMYSKYSCDSSKKVDYRWQCDYPVSCKYPNRRRPAQQLDWEPQIGPDIQHYMPDSSAGVYRDDMYERFSADQGESCGEPAGGKCCMAFNTDLEDLYCFYEKDSEEGAYGTCMTYESCDSSMYDCDEAMGQCGMEYGRK